MPPCEDLVALPHTLPSASSAGWAYSRVTEAGSEAPGGSVVGPPQPAGSGPSALCPISLGGVCRARTRPVPAQGCRAHSLADRRSHGCPLRSVVGEACPSPGLSVARAASWAEILGAELAASCDRGQGRPLAAGPVVRGLCPRGLLKVPVIGGRVFPVPCDKGLEMFSD